MQESVAVVEMLLVSVRTERTKSGVEKRDAWGWRGIEFTFEQEIMAIRQEIDGLFTRPSPMGNYPYRTGTCLCKVGSITMDRFSIREIQEQISVTCMEQGRIYVLRQRYANAYNSQQDVLGRVLSYLDQSQMKMID